MKLDGPLASSGALGSGKSRVDVRVLFIVLRIAGAGVIAAALVAQYIHSVNFRADRGIAENGVPTANFFSYFTNESGILMVGVLIVGAILLIRTPGTEPLWFGVGRAAVTAYMATTGIVYNALLRGIPVDEGSSLAWTNEVLHVVAPILIVVDWVFAPGRRRLDWAHIWVIVAFPIIWAIYTLIRAPFVFDPTKAVLEPGYTGGWYPYPFLNPGTSPEGYLSVALYILGIAAVIGSVGAAIVWAARRPARWLLPAAEGVTAG